MKVRLQEVFDTINQAAAPYRPKRTVIVQHVPEEQFTLDITFPNSLMSEQYGSRHIEAVLRTAVLNQFGESADVEVISSEYRELPEGPESTVYLRARVHDTPYADYLGTFRPGRNNRSKQT
jgi:hypothetical protein